MSTTITSDGDGGVRLIVKDRKPSKSMHVETRSPVHVMYGGAHLFRADTPQKLGKIALKTVETFGPNFVEFAVAMRLRGAETLPYDAASISKLEKTLSKSVEKIRAENFPAWFAWQVYRRTINRLKTEPVEDFRIDFEDGYGFRSDREENDHAVSASDELAKAFLSGSITPFSGFRIKSLAPETYGRAVSTLNLFIENFLKKSGGKLPENFVVTLPKVSGVKEVKELVRRLKRIEKQAGLADGAIGIELMIETPQAVVNQKGRIALADLIKAAKGRCTSAHFGAYDYTAALGISAANQSLHHKSCEFARQMMLIALSPLNIRLSDSITTEIPVPVHKGDNLPDKQIRENRHAVHRAWHTHFENVTNSMKDGFYQSWDLHPNQLVPRFAAVNAFYLDGVDEQAVRLKGFVEKATQATLTGSIFDDAASARGLVNFFVRGINAGALSQVEVENATGSSIDDLKQLFSYA